MFEDGLAAENIIGAYGTAVDGTRLGTDRMNNAPLTPACRRRFAAGKKKPAHLRRLV